MFFVTGPTGFIGKQVVRRLVREVGASNLSLLVFEPDEDMARLYPGIRCTLGSLSDREKLVEAMKGADVVVHLASKNVDRDGTGFHEANVQGTRNLCDVALKCGVKRLIYLSSVGVYGHGLHRDDDETRVVTPDTDFSRSKASAERIVLGHHVAGDFQGIVLRTRFVYGEGDVNVVANLIKIAKKNRFMIDHGRAASSFVLVDDLAEIVVRFSTREIVPDEHPVYHVTDGVPVSYREVMGVICDSYGLKRPSISVPFWLLYLPIRFVEMLFRIDPEVTKFPLSSIRLKLLGQDNFFSNEKLRRAFPDLELTPFVEGFERAAGYYGRFL